MGWINTYLIDDTMSRDICTSDAASYLLEDGQLMNVSTCVAWCRVCNDIRMVEHVPTIEEATAAFTNADKYTLRVFKKDTIAYIIAHDRQLTCHWRTKRTSPAKCLFCGGTDFYRFEDNACRDDISGHTFQLNGFQHFSECWPITRSLYSPEGDFIRKETSSLD